MVDVEGREGVRRHWVVVAEALESCSRDIKALEPGVVSCLHADERPSYSIAEAAAEALRKDIPGEPERVHALEATTAFFSAGKVHFDYAKGAASVLRGIRKDFGPRSEFGCSLSKFVVQFQGLQHNKVIAFFLPRRI